MTIWPPKMPPASGPSPSVAEEEVASHLYSRYIDMFPVREAHITQLSRGDFLVKGRMARLGPIVIARSKIKLHYWAHIVPNREFIAFLIPHHWHRDYLVNGVGLPHEAIPVPQLESGAHLPASGLSGAERKPGQKLAAKSSLELVCDSRAR